AVHSRLGNVSTAVGSAGGTSTTLVGGETLELNFATTPIASTKTRDLFFQVKGSYSLQPASRASDVSLVNQDEKFEFVLGPAHPNPSSGNVSFSFTMAKEGPASIRVYDVAGRLVKSLVSGTTEAGPHDIVWNATDDGGRHVGAGVYFYRMDAG